MGVIFSHLRDIYHGLRGLLAVIAESNEAFDQVLARIKAPQLPCPNPTTSFWQQQPLYPALVNVRSEKLPDSADIVIIGSGMSGASIAHAILHECQSIGISRKVVILEGRATCSGATGRNGGHIKVAPVVEYAKFKNRFGAKSARKIVEFCLKHRPFLLRLVKEEEGLDGGEVREVRTVDACTDEGMLREATKMLDILREDWPELAETIQLLDAKELQEEFGFNDHFLGGMTYPSGAMWPYRLVTSIYKSLLEKYPSQFSIETSTMVQAIETTTLAKTPYFLKTSRGDLACSHVIHATDAFVANLVPGLVGKVFPLRGHMSAQKPGTAFPNYDGKVSWSVVGSKDYEYITQRPGLPDAADGLGAEIMAGGGTIHSAQNGMDEFGQWGDDKLSHPIASYLTGLLPNSFDIKLWGGGADSSVKAMWSGSMGFTADMMPFVGRLSPTLTGRLVPNDKRNNTTATSVPGPCEWISAGFNGSGMVMTWLSGVAVGLMVLDREEASTKEVYWRPEGAVADWLPEEFICTDRRVARSSICEFPSLL